ncbi:MAG: type II toxin-antitoxin system RelE/ParE family toxin [Taibaiella sp.]|nr:type II toxin-antitoxin system RelE/ParE family toxin [Taibaiella sp.]
MADKIANLAWGIGAIKNAEALYDYISLDSKKNADKVINKIIDITDTLPLNPEKFPLDKLKRNNDGTYRAFLVFKYRVSYRVLPKSIKILRIRHSSMEPVKY